MASLGNLLFRGIDRGLRRTVDQEWEGFVDSHCRSVIGSIVVQSGCETVAFSWQDVSAALNVHVGCSGDNVMPFSAGCVIAEAGGVRIAFAFSGEPFQNTFNFPFPFKRDHIGLRHMGIVLTTCYRLILRDS